MRSVLLTAFIAVLVGGIEGNTGRAASGQDEPGGQGPNIIIAQALKTRGYATACIGTWHLGNYGNVPAHHPRRHGFDYYFGRHLAGEVIVLEEGIRQVATVRWFLQCVTGIIVSWTAGHGLGQASGDDGTSWPYPRLATAETRADPQTLAALEKPGKVFFQDDFESPKSLKKYFEIRGLREGRAKLVTDPKLAHSGNGAIQFTAAARDGRESGAGASGWFGPDGYDRVYFRRYVKFAADYDQGNLNHVGGGLAAIAGSDRYRAMGSAGIRPRGDDHFNSAFEPWRDWSRLSAPGYMFLYT